MKLILFFIFFSLSTFAADTFVLDEEEINPETEEVLIKRPEKYLRNESVIYNFNTDLGIKDQRQYTGADKNRFSIAGHVSGDYEHFNEILGFEINYMLSTQRHIRIWYGFQFFQHNTYFDAITQNHAANSSASPSVESQFQRP